MARLPAGTRGTCLFALACVVLEQLLDQVDVGEDHAAAAVARETEGIESFAEGTRRVSWCCGVCLQRSGCGAYTSGMPSWVSISM
jgi:hypothetical protein